MYMYIPRYMLVCVCSGVFVVYTVCVCVYVCSVLCVCVICMICVMCDMCDVCHIQGSAMLSEEYQKTMHSKTSTAKPDTSKPDTSKPDEIVINTFLIFFVYLYGKNGDSPITQNLP